MQGMGVCIRTGREGEIMSDQEEYETHCAKCGEWVYVKDGYDWSEGDWCYECLATHHRAIVELLKECKDLFDLGAESNSDLVEADARRFVMAERSRIYAAIDAVLKPTPTYPEPKK